jgi:hypothetical protein
MLRIYTRSWACPDALDVNHHADPATVSDGEDDTLSTRWDYGAPFSRSIASKVLDIACRAAACRSQPALRTASQPAGQCDSDPDIPLMYTYAEIISMLQPSNHAPVTNPWFPLQFRPS